MKCAICGFSELVDRKTTEAFEENGKIVVIRDIPGHICNNCGDAIFDEEVARALNEMVDKALEARLRFSIKDYAVT